MTYRPRGYLRKVLSEDEHVLAVVRRHWFVLLGKTLLWMTLTLAAVVMAGWLYWRDPLSAGWVWIAGLGLIPLAGWIWEHLVWKNQMTVLTDRRVLQMEGVLNKRVADSLLEKLNDVKTEQTLLGRIFGYGDVEILTASEIGANQLRTLTDPLGFKRAMLAAKEALDDERAGQAG